MRYTLSSIRKIGKYTQKCIVNCNDTYQTDPLTTGHNQFTNLSYYPQQLISFDNSGWTVGTIKYNSFVEESTDLITNTQTKADITIDFINENNGMPYVYSFKMLDILKANILSSLSNKIGIITAGTFPNSNIYIINAIFDLHD